MLDAEKGLYQDLILDAGCGKRIVSRPLSQIKILRIIKNIRDS
jgi:hypothetical protein